MNTHSTHFQQGSTTIDLEQADQFQNETVPRSTATASTDPYASAQVESHRRREQGDSNDYRPRFEDQ